MTQDEMRVAVAEECGAKRRPDLDYMLFAPVYVAGNTVEMWEINGSVVPRGKLPNYPADLNACAEFEEMLNEKEQVWYLQKLTQVRLRQGDRGTIACMIDRLAFATAPQRCEAFLRMRGKWKE